MRERDVAECAEGCPRQRHPKDVPLDHGDVGLSMEPATKGVRERRVEFDGHNVACGQRQGFRESPGSGSDLDDQIIGLDGRHGDQITGERAAPKEVLAARPSFV
jgi:hypothetical protein